MAAMSFGALGGVASSAAVYTLGGAIASLAVDFAGLRKDIRIVNIELEKFFNNLSSIESLNVKVVFEAVAQGISEMNTQISNMAGDEAIKFHSVLENMALISSGRASMAGSQVAVNTFSPLMTFTSPDVNVLNDFGNLQLVIEDGEAFKVSMRKIIKE